MSTLSNSSRHKSSCVGIPKVNVGCEKGCSTENISTMAYWYQFMGERFIFKNDSIHSLAYQCRNGLAHRSMGSKYESYRSSASTAVTVGLAKTYPSKSEFTVEGYYKKMSNLIEYKDGATYLNIEGDWQDKVETGGHGKSYGIEFFAQRKVGMINGWLGYSLSKTTRQFEFLNFGRTFPYKYDRRYDIHVALVYDGEA